MTTELPTDDRNRTETETERNQPVDVALDVALDLADDRDVRRHLRRAQQARVARLYRGRDADVREAASAVLSGDYDEDDLETLRDAGEEVGSL